MRVVMNDSIHHFANGRLRIAPAVLIAVMLAAGLLAAVFQPRPAYAAPARPPTSLPVLAPHGAAARRAVAALLTSSPAVTCPDVYFLGARGSGEKGTSTYQGMGPEVDKMAKVIQSILTADRITFKTLADIYPADSVTDLVPTSAELANALSGLLEIPPILTGAAAAYYYDHNVKKYLGSLSVGIANAVSEAKFLHAQCPRALLILAGYSQGAMAMHQAELRLAASHDTGVLDQIAGTLLLGDGDRVKDTAGKQFGTSKSSAQGIRTYLKLNSDRDVLDPATTANICNAGDIVCDFNLWTLAHTILKGTGTCVHESYAALHKGCKASSHNNALTQGATWVANLVVARLASNRWTSAEAPSPPGSVGNVQLNGVACPSSTRCVAVGYYTESSGGTPGLLLTMTGTSWKAETAPTPADSNSTPNVNLNSVACSSPSWCVAVGTYTDSAGNSQGLLLTWSGTKWTAAQAPLPPPDPGYEVTGGTLTSVACPSPSSCVATGSYGQYDTSAGESAGGGLLLNWSGSSWTPTAAPGTTESVGPVVCSSASSCTAVGSFGCIFCTNGAGVLLLTWSAGAWTATDAPWPAGTTPSQDTMDSAVLACATASACMVSAHYALATAVSGYGVMLSGSGTTWTDTKINGGLLYSAACPSASSCVFGGTGQVLEGLGTTWKAVTLPPLASGALMAALACPSARSCAIASQFTDDADPVIVTGGGPMWSAAELSLPASADGEVPGFDAMACASVTVCVAVGNYDDSGTLEGLIATGPS